MVTNTTSKKLTGLQKISTNHKQTDLILGAFQLESEKVFKHQKPKNFVKYMFLLQVEYFVNSALIGLLLYPIDNFFCQTFE